MDTNAIGPKPTPYEPPPSASSSSKTGPKETPSKTNESQKKAALAETPAPPPTPAEMKGTATFLQKLGLEKPPPPPKKPDNAVTFVKNAYAGVPSATSAAAKEAMSKTGLLPTEQAACKVAVEKGTGKTLSKLGEHLGKLPGEIAGEVVGHFVGKQLAEAMCQPVEHESGITEADAKALAEKKAPDFVPTSPRSGNASSVKDPKQTR
jgi:hypothetical protein